MLAGLPYKAWLDGLSEERMENKKRIYRYNSLSPEQIVNMDWLAENVVGSLPRYDQLSEVGKATVDMVGVDPSKDKSGGIHRQT